MANPPGVDQEQSRHHHHHHHPDGASSSSSFNHNTTTANSMMMERTSACMKHNPGISTDWTPEEHAILEDGLRKYTSDPNLVCYAKIATQLQNKTVRDVALRCRWMALRFKKENTKRRKEDLTKRNKDKKERVIDSSANSAYFTMQFNIPPYATPRIPTDCDDGISCRAIGGPMGEILEHNAKVIQQISANLESLQLQDNINLFCQTRDNITKIMNQLNDMPEKMRQMPPLPVRINEELANAILPPQNYHRQ